MNKVTDPEILDKLQEAENVLAREERKKLGDLADLPTGHPVLLAIEESKRRYEEKEKLNSTRETKKRSKSTRDQKSKHGQEKKVEERVGETRIVVAKINDKIEGTIESLKGLADTISQGRELLTDYPFAKVRMDKLERTLFAFHRALVDSRISKSRIQE